MVVSSADGGAVYALRPGGQVALLKPEPAAGRPGKSFFLPVSDWHLNRADLSHPMADFISPDGTTALPAGSDFLSGATSWGVLSSPQIRSFGLGEVVPGKPFYVTSESELRTWAADAEADGSLKNFRLFAEEGGEGVAVDSRGNVYVAAGQIYVYDPAGKQMGTIEVPERPAQLVFGGPGRKTLFIAARSSLYSVRVKFAGR